MSFIHVFLAVTIEFVTHLYSHVCHNVCMTKLPILCANGMSFTCLAVMTTGLVARFHDTVTENVTAWLSGTAAVNGIVF